MTVEYDYLLFLPENYGNARGVKWPLVLFLHGSGEMGYQLERVKRHGPPKFLDARPEFPAIVVSPQSPGFGWDLDRLTALVDDVMDKYAVDPDRVYVTGLSMGGHGSWALATKDPRRFAAVVPICGWGNPADARRLVDVPIWAFHGRQDTSVPPGGSRKMVSAIRKASGKKVKLTVYPDADHDSWTRTYDDPKVWQWMFAQSRSSRTQSGH